MANAKELRKQIGSIKNTQKITKAMEMVAASKMRKAQQRMARGRPYSDYIRAVIGHVANASPEYRHLFMIEREVKRVGYIVVTTDKGLCGGLNVNLLKRVVVDLKKLSEQGIEYDLCFWPIVVMRTYSDPGTRLSPHVACTPGFCAACQVRSKRARVGTS